MLGSVKQFFDCFLNPGADDADSVQQHKVQLACAALLFELTVADQQRSEEELVLLRAMLRDTFQLDEQALDQLWELGQREAKSATSLYQFTSLINEGFDYQQKITLLGQLWLLAFADNRQDNHEEHLIRRIADLLYLSHGDFIRAKLVAKATLPAQ